MSDETEPMTVAIPPPEDVEEEITPPKPEAKRNLADEDLKMIEKIVQQALGTEEERENVRNTVKTLLRKVGAMAVAYEDGYTPGNMLEEVLHYMRWKPGYLFECPVDKAHEYEMCLASHILYVKIRENYLNVICDIAEKNQRQARKLAAAYCPGKSVGEREAMAMEVSVALRTDQKQLDQHLILREQLHGLADLYVQMDNSLKKTLDRRRNDTLHESGHERKATYE